jgi:hypothetical protein
MRLLGKTASVLGVAGALALSSMTASDARGRGAAVAAGAAGFVAGAAIGSAAAASTYPGYYGPAYGYDSYAYAPEYVPPSYYGPVGGYRYGYTYDSNYTGPWHERQLQGRD